VAEELGIAAKMRCGYWRSPECVSFHAWLELRDGEMVLHSPRRGVVEITAATACFETDGHVTQLGRRAM
jgi:hypothetical protein